MLDTILTNAKADPQVQGRIKVEKSQMDALAKHARIYYKERQGKIFNPLTDRGKARLEVVETMIRKTEKIFEANKAQENTAQKNRNHAAPQKS